MTAAGWQVVETSFIDLSMLRELREVGGQALVVRKIDAFLESSPPLAEQAREAAAQGDLGALAEAVRAMRSSAGSLGAFRLQHLAADIQRLCEAKDTQHLTFFMAEYEEEYSRVCDWLRREKERGELRRP